MFEVTFRFRHGCHVGQLSARHPEVPIAQWCNFHVEVLELQTTDGARAAAMVRDLQAITGREVRTFASDLERGGVQMLQVPCQHKRAEAIGSFIEKHGCLYLQPLLYQGGWERYRILAFADEDLRALFDDLGQRGEAELLTKRAMRGGLMNRVFMIPANELLAGLTPKQARALLDAVEHGYYKVPRGTRFEDIAKARGVPRTTYEEHVRKAEGKVMTSVAPYLALYVREREEGKGRDGPGGQRPEAPARRAGRDGAPRAAPAAKATRERRGTRPPARRMAR